MPTPMPRAERGSDPKSVEEAAEDSEEEVEEEDDDDDEQVDPELTEAERRRAQ